MGCGSEKAMYTPTTTMLWTDSEATSGPILHIYLYAEERALAGCVTYQHCKNHRERSRECNWDNPH